MRNDDVISVGNMSMSTLNNQEIKDYPTGMKARTLIGESGDKSGRKNKSSMTSLQQKPHNVNNIFDYGTSPSPDIPENLSAL